MSKMGEVQENYDLIRDFISNSREEAAEKAAKLIDYSYDACVKHAIDIEPLIYDYLPPAVKNKQEIIDYYNNPKP